MSLSRVLAILVIGMLLQAAEVKNVLVYKEAGRYGGWPANHGIWSWGNEILVGFSAAYFLRKAPDGHQYDNHKPEEPRLARSLDGGETWTIESPRSLLPAEQGGIAVTDLTEPMDFTAPGFAMTIRFTDSNKGPSRIWYSKDRGKLWLGPYRFPLFDQPGILGRTDYIVNGKRDAFAFLTASKRNAKEGRVMCARTKDGGLTWQFVSWLGEEPKGFSIMPSSVRLDAHTIVSATRVKQDAQTNWIDLYRSTDNGSTWKLLPRPVPSTGGFSGNPPSMIRLQDGRLCLTYGYRSLPYAVRARLSSDGGDTWGPEIELRKTATWELAYVRTVQRTDGKVVSVYYMAQDDASERVISATIWDPGEK